MNLNARQTMDSCGCQSRRRTYVATKVVGELPRSADPAVSEWGNPPLVGIRRKPEGNAVN